MRRRLDGVVVSVLAIGPNVRAFKLGRGGGFLRAMKIRSTPLIGAEVKPEASCRKILLYVKNSMRVKEKRIRQNP
jgi:hypothetical protein